ncbi:MAG: endonuclease VII domain-containing protein [Nitrospira sp. BO4]|jgi:hypothetical protein|nr:endonuclease VII domain-containing protein [Nitrospira sp. BO4]
MLPDGVPDVFKLAEIIRDVNSGRYPSVQHMATAYDHGDRWAKQVFKAAKASNLLPQDMTHREWMDLFTTTRHLSKAARMDKARRRAKLQGLQVEFTSRWMEEQREVATQWTPERTFKDLSLEFVLTTHKYDDLSTEQKKIVKEKLAEHQKGVCAICRKPFSTDRIPCLDHCHETGNIRGMLCCFCNMGLGGFKDSALSLENAIKYLLDHMAGQPYGTA